MQLALAGDTVPPWEESERRSGLERRLNDRATPDRRRRGRPPRVKGKPASRRQMFWLTEDEEAALKAAAAESGLPVATLIRDAVNEFVADYTDRRIFRRY